MARIHSTEKDILTAIFAVISALLLLSLISKIIKELSTGRGTSIVSEEGSAILRDKEKSKKVMERIEQYHKTGEWEKTKT